MNSVGVIVSGAQMECCGVPFAIGNYVEWLVEQVDDNWTFHIDIGEMKYEYNHHTKWHNALLKITGKVTDIKGFYRMLVKDPKTSTEKSINLMRVSEEGFTESVIKADDWKKRIDVEAVEKGKEIKEIDTYFVQLEDVNVSSAKESEVTYCE